MRMLKLTAACAALALGAAFSAMPAQADNFGDTTIQTRCDKDKITCATFRCDRYDTNDCERISDWYHRGRSDSSFRYRPPYHHRRDFEERLRCTDDGQNCVPIKCDVDEGKCLAEPTQVDD
jgi:hypothetical protein